MGTEDKVMIALRSLTHEAIDGLGYEQLQRLESALHDREAVVRNARRKMAAERERDFRKTANT